MSSEALAGRSLLKFGNFQTQRRRVVLVGKTLYDVTLMHIIFLRRLPILPRALYFQCRYSSRNGAVGGQFTATLTETDEYGIPARPTWSVHDLLSSYPKPTLSDEILKKLHDLSALTPPAEESIEYAKLKNEMEELIRLVEAVKLVDTTGVIVQERWVESDADRSTPLDPVENDSSTYGTSLLKNAVREKDGFYVVDADRRRQ